MPVCLASGEVCLKQLHYASLKCLYFADTRETCCNTESLIQHCNGHDMTSLWLWFLLFLPMMAL